MCSTVKSSLKYLSLAGLLFGVLLLFYDPTSMGKTLDEWYDFIIAKKGSFLTDVRDPSQGRLTHILSFLWFSIFGEGLLQFKLLFILIAATALVLMYVHLRRRLTPEAALLFVAVMSNSAFFLGAARTSATGGDVLVLLMWALFSIALGSFKPESWKHHAGIGMLIGLAIGAKLTSAILIAPYLVILFLRSGVTFWKFTFVGGIAAVITTFLANPLFFRGMPYVWMALESARRFEGDERLILGSWHTGVSYLYPLAVLVSKLTIPLLVLFVYGVVKLRKSLREELWIWPHLAAIICAIPYFFKSFQNAQYYVVVLVPVLAIAAFGYEKLRTTFKVPVATALLGINLLVVINVYPDYLQAGRRFGSITQGQFWGPAVNHCQGSRHLIDYVAGLKDQGSVYNGLMMYKSCYINMDHDRYFYPRTGLRIVKYDPDRMPRTRFFYFVVPRVMRYWATSQEEFRLNQIEIMTITRPCDSKEFPGDLFEVWRCPVPDRAS